MQPAIILTDHQTAFCSQVLLRLHDRARKDPRHNRLVTKEQDYSIYPGQRNRGALNWDIQTAKDIGRKGRAVSANSGQGSITASHLCCHTKLEAKIEKRFAQRTNWDIEMPNAPADMNEIHKVRNELRTRREVRIRRGNLRFVCEFLSTEICFLRVLINQTNSSFQSNVLLNWKWTHSCVFASLQKVTLRWSFLERVMRSRTALECINVYLTLWEVRFVKAEVNIVVGIKQEIQSWTEAQMVFFLRFTYLELRFFFDWVLASSRSSGVLG